jgi:hypothetical protein
MSCLFCGKEYKFSEDSPEAKGIFNVFCPDNEGKCEDMYTWLGARR